MKLQGANGLLVSVQNAGSEQALNINARTPADPTAWQPWETFEEESWGPNLVALKCTGRYASAQPDGRLEWNRPWVRSWEIFERVRSGAYVAYRSTAHNRYLCTDLMRPVVDASGLPGHMVVCDREFMGPWELFTQYGAAKYPLHGRMYVKNGQFHDATGPVHLLAHHDMPLLRVHDENPSEAGLACDAVARVGSATRIMWRLADDYDTPNKPGDYWYGRSISRTCMRHNLIPVLNLFAARGLKAILTMGALSKNDSEEIALHEECIDMIVRSGHQETIALAEHRNEPDSTSQYAYDPPKGWALAKKTMQLWRERVGCIVTGGSWGDNDKMLAASDGMDSLDYHEERTMPDCIHHIHTAWNDWIFHGKAQGKGLYGGERPGPNAPYPENTNINPHASLGGDMYVGCDDPELAWGVVGQAHFTGQATAWLNGPGVRHNVALDSTVFWDSLPSLVHTYIPKDAGLWRGPNPSWRTPGTFASSDKRFMYAGLAEWNQTGNPPFKVASWQAIGPNGITDEGTGPIRIKTPWKWRLVVGRFE